MRRAVGGLLLIFGLQWLRKAILRASGHKVLHDETLAYETVLTEARGASIARRPLVASIPVAVLAAIAAVLLVAVAGFAIRAPLSRVPENAMKFVVGVFRDLLGRRRRWRWWLCSGVVRQLPRSPMSLRQGDC